MSQEESIAIFVPPAGVARTTLEASPSEDNGPEVFLLAPTAKEDRELHLDCVISGNDAALWKVNVQRDGVTLAPESRWEGDERRVHFIEGEGDATTECLLVPNNSSGDDWTSSECLQYATRRTSIAVAFDMQKLKTLVRGRTGRDYELFYTDGLMYFTPEEIPAAQKKELARKDAHVRALNERIDELQQRVATMAHDARKSDEETQAAAKRRRLALNNETPER